MYLKVDKKINLLDQIGKIFGKTKERILLTLLRRLMNIN